MRMLILILFLLSIFGCASQDEAGAIVAITDGKTLIGTGFVTSKGIITASHVAKRIDTIFVVYDNGKKTKAHIIETHEDKDYVVMKTDSIVKSNELELANDVDLKVLSNVYSIGHPDGIGYVYYKGYVQKVTDTFYFLSFDIAGGMSGAPVLGINGKVYGLITKKTFFGIAVANKL